MSAVDLEKKVVSIGGVANENIASKKLAAISQNSKSTPTIIARDLVIEGEISSSGLIEIEGRVKGIIRGNVIILREHGFVDGTIVAESLSIRGSFDGTIRANNVDVSGKAKLVGEIEYGSLIVEDGACIDAHFKKMILSQGA